MTTHTAADVRPFRYSTKTAEEWAEIANRADAASIERMAAREESWERSDTDGFLTQWAAQSMSREYDAVVEWALDAGTTGEQVLLNLDGTVASTHHKDGQYGEYWVLNDEAAARYGKRFFSESKANTWEKKARAHAKKGFVIAMVRVNGSRPKLRGNNAMSVSPWSYADLDDLRAGRFEIEHADWFMELSRRWERDEADPIDLADAAAGNMTPGSEY